MMVQIVNWVWQLFCSLSSLRSWITEKNNVRMRLMGLFKLRSWSSLSLSLSLSLSSLYYKICVSLFVLVAISLCVSFFVKYGIFISFWVHKHNIKSKRALRAKGFLQIYTSFIWSWYIYLYIYMGGRVWDFIA